MISNLAELTGSIRYIQRWTETLEAMRSQAADSDLDASLYPTQSSGPIAEIRRVLDDVRGYVEDLQAQSPDVSGFASTSNTEVEAKELVPT